jgi:flagellar biosynthesis protein FlhA
MPKSTIVIINNGDRSSRDIGFALSIVFVLCVFFLPIPPLILDIGLAFSIALSVLVLMVSLWIQKPLDFSSFPTVLLVATILRLSLNIATTRLILSFGAEGSTAAGFIIAGFSRLIMSGDFVIGLTVFAIIVTVNFLVITKGATRIAEVGARFTLDAIPGKQMAIDADLSAGIIDEQEAQIRRRELEEESAFFGSMDGASKFVRGDAIAGLIILAVNIFGGIIIGVTRHGMTLAAAADAYTKLSVGDGLVSQIPALIVSLSAGLLVSKGGMRGSAEQNILRQLGMYPKALSVAAFLMFLLGLMPGLPFFPFFTLGSSMAVIAYLIPLQLRRAEEMQLEQQRLVDQRVNQEAQDSPVEILKTSVVEIKIGKQLWANLIPKRPELIDRANKMRRNFAIQYGFIFPDIRLTDSLDIDPKSYQIHIQGAYVSSYQLPLRRHLIIYGSGPAPEFPGENALDPAFGMKALWISQALVETARTSGFLPVDPNTVLLTHIAETLRNHLSALLTYKGMRSLVDRLDPEYRRLIDEIVPNHISYSTLYSVFKLILSERVSIRNLELILEAIAEIAPFAKRPEAITEHVRMRLASQICSDLSVDGTLHILRLGSQWDKFLHDSVRKDVKGDIIGFDADASMIEKFSHDLSASIRHHMDRGETFAILTTPDARSYVRLIIGRLHPSQAILSHLEIGNGVKIHYIGSVG